MKIAYFINQYPKVSHSFIRREILALERLGHHVERVALRGWDAELVDTSDIKELEQTHFLLKNGLLGLFKASLFTFLNSPIKFLSTLAVAIRLGLHADRSWPYHLIYLAEACAFLSRVRGKDVQHVHAHFGTNSAEVVMLLKLLGGPSYSFTVHGPEEFDKPEFIKLKDKVKNAAFVAAISSYTRSQLFRWVDYKDWHKINVVHCGLESSFYDVKPEPIPEAPKLVCVGRICEQKGQLLIVNAVNLLVKKGIKIDLVLAGDGEMRGEIEKLIADYALQNHITITGWISSEQVREQILAARALVLPSFAEGLPVVIMEALALKRPVLTTYIAGIPELVRNGESGWLFPAGDIAELARVMEEFLATPLDKLNQMGEVGYQRVLQRHSIDIEAAKLELLFSKSIEANAPENAASKVGLA